jgi:hypothetical protein
LRSISNTSPVELRRTPTSRVLVRLIVLSITGDRANGRSQQEPTVDPSKSRRSIPAKADGRSQQEPTVDPSKSRRLIPSLGRGGLDEAVLVAYPTLVFSSPRHQHGEEEDDEERTTSPAGDTVRGVPGGLRGRRPTSSGCSPSAGTRSTGGASTSGCAGGPPAPSAGPRRRGRSAARASYLDRAVVGSVVAAIERDGQGKSHGGLGPRQLVAYGLLRPPQCNTNRTSKRPHTALVVFRLGRTDLISSIRFASTS